MVIYVNVDCIIIWYWIKRWWFYILNYLMVIYINAYSIIDELINGDLCWWFMLIYIVLMGIELKDDITDEFGIYCTYSGFIIEDIKWYAFIMLKVYLS